MSRRKGARFPSRVAVLLAAATAVPLVALLWVCLRVLAQDRALEGQQIRQRVERAADIATAALERTRGRHPRGVLTRGTRIGRTAH